MAVTTLHVMLLLLCLMFQLSVLLLWSIAYCKGYPQGISSCSCRSEQGARGRRVAHLQPCCSPHLHCLQ